MDPSLARIETFLDDTNKSQTTRTPITVTPAPVPQPTTQQKSKKETETFLSRNIPEIGKYKTKLEGWTEHEGEEATPSASPTLGALVASHMPSPAPLTKTRSSPDVSQESPQADVDASQPTPANKRPATKAERRALQEQQRAAKAALKDQNVPSKAAPAPATQSQTKPQPAQPAQPAQPKSQAGPPAAKDAKVTKPKEQKEEPKPTADQKKSKSKTQAEQPVEHFRQNATMFSHLPPHSSMLSPDVVERRRRKLAAHPSITRLGLKYEQDVISNSDERCYALLLALKEAIQDYEMPPSEQIRHDLLRYVSAQINYLAQSRPLSPAMGQSIKAIKQVISELDAQVSFEEGKAQILNEIDTFMLEKILHPRNSISKFGASCIKDGDVILLFQCSGLIELVITTALSEKKKIRVVVVDSRPNHEGLEMANRVASLGVDVTFVQLHGVCYIMREVTKTFLSAASLLSNGYVYAQAGTALVAMTSFQYKVPVIVFCETYKFVDAARLDSIVMNEMGNPDDLVTRNHLQLSHKPLQDWREFSNLKLVNLLFDVTPIKFVNMVITDVGMIPPTAIPVVIREYQRTQGTSA